MVGVTSAVPLVAPPVSTPWSMVHETVAALESHKSVVVSPSVMVSRDALILTTGGRLTTTVTSSDTDPYSFVAVMV